MRNTNSFPTTRWMLVAAAALAVAAGAQAQNRTFGGSPAQVQTPTSGGTVPAGPSANASKDAATLDEAFTRADVNADGALSPQEASRLPAIAAKFAELDKNGDGLLSKVEFSAGYLASP